MNMKNPTLDIRLYTDDGQVCVGDLRRVLEEAACSLPEDMSTAAGPLADGGIWNLTHIPRAVSTKLGMAPMAESIHTNQLWDLVHRQTDRITSLEAENERLRRGVLRGV